MAHENERGYTVSRTIMLIPTGTSVGLTSVSLGVIRAMEQKGVSLAPLLSMNPLFRVSKIQPHLHHYTIQLT